MMEIKPKAGWRGTVPMDAESIAARAIHAEVGTGVYADTLRIARRLAATVTTSPSSAGLTAAYPGCRLEDCADAVNRTRYGNATFSEYLKHVRVFGDDALEVRYADGGVIHVRDHVSYSETIDRFVLFDGIADDARILSLTEEVTRNDEIQLVAYVRFYDAPETDKQEVEIVPETGDGFVEITIPSKYGDHDVVAHSVVLSGLKQYVARKLSEHFGGSTLLVHGTGYYVSDLDGRLIEEDVTIARSHYFDESTRDVTGIGFAIADYVKRNLAQERVMLNVNGHVTFV